MAIKTIRFNKKEEQMLRKVLVYYKQDFSGCVKKLLSEKLEDLQDVSMIKGIKEEKRADYLSAAEIDALFD